MMEELDQKSIESFFNVAVVCDSSGTDVNVNAGPSECGTSGSTVGILRDATANDLENISLVLRSRGEPFPPPSATDEPRLPFVVGLAHHRPTDVFMLFAFTSQTIPCRMARFDQYGEVVEREISEGNCNTGSFMWSKADAAALVAAVNKCQQVGYFDTSPANATSEDDKIPTLETEAEEERCLRERGDYLRLVPWVAATIGDGEGIDEQSDCTGNKTDEEPEEDKLEEAKAMRSIIMKELIPSTGREGLDFHHPDPNFLLPLSNSILDELGRWRSLVDDALPPPEDWPKLTLPPASNERIVDGGEMTDIEEKEFERIKAGRKDQLEREVNLCQRALTKMESLLNAALASAERGNEGHFCLGMKYGFLLGKEGIASIAALEQLQGWHMASWREYHDVIEDACNAMDMGHGGDSNGILKPWLENKADKPLDPSSDIDSVRCKDVDLDCQQGDDVDMRSVNEHGADSLAEELVGSWIKEDRALLDTLSNTVSLLHDSIAALDQLRAARARIQSAQRDILLRLKEKAERSTAVTVKKLVKLWNEAIPDDEASDNEEPWIRGTLWPQWDEDAVEAHLSFGWRVSDREEHSTMSFTVDHVGFVQVLKVCIEDLPGGYENEESYSGKTDRYMSCWERAVKPAIDEALRSADQFLKSGDLRNASILIICCSYVLCDRNVAGKALGLCSNGEYRDYLEDAFFIKTKKAMRELDIHAIRTSMAFFDEESTLIRAGAHWLFDLMKSGALYFPASLAEIKWEAVDNGGGWRGGREPHWRNYSHPAAAIFRHYGWRHPTLCSAIKGDKDSVNKWSDMEAPEIIRERHNFMTKRDKITEAIALAKMGRGDTYALRYLLQNGLSNDAIEEASASENMEGLAQLSKDLISTEPFASLLCMQAHVLGLVEKYAKSGCTQMYFRTLEMALNFFNKKWHGALVAEENNDRPCMPVSPLRIFCTVSLTRTFLLGAKSTHDMQSLLEKGNFPHPELPLVMAVLATVTQASHQSVEPHKLHEPIEYFLSQTNLLSTDSERHSGALTELGYFPSSFGREGFLDLCCALYEIAKFLMEKQCTSAFCVDLAVFSTMQMTLLTGSQMWLLNFVETLQEMFKDEVESLDSLAFCYAKLFASNCPRYPILSEALLSSFLKVGTLGSAPYYDLKCASEQCRFWAAIAYMQECSAYKAANALVYNIRLGQPTNESSEYDTDKFEKMVMGMLRDISTIDKMDSTSGKYVYHPMSPFVQSPRRRGVTELERDQMTCVCIENLFATSFSFSQSAIAELIDLHVAASSSFSSFWSHGANDVDDRISNLTGLVLALSKKKSLLQTSKVMIYLDKSLRDDEAWCGRHIILELGLSWLRDALCSTKTGVIQFENGETLRHWNDSGFMENYTTYFERYHWDYPRTYFSRSNDLTFDNAPKYAAKGLIAVLQANILLLEDETPHLAKYCTEAMALSSVLDFIILPTPKRLDRVIASQNALGLLVDEFPVQLRPERLLTLILDSRWSSNPDFPLSMSFFHSYAREESFIVPRILTALSRGQISGSVSLCLESSSGNFWSDLSDRSRNGGGETMRRAREILQGCLLILKAAISARKDLPKDFINIAMHLMISLNWFPACEMCSPDLQICRGLLYNTPVSCGNVAALHETALSWCEFLDGNGTDCDNFTAPLVHCLNVIRCLSRCIQGCAENHSLDQCKKCGFKGDGNYNADLDKINGDELATSARDERAKSRKKRKLQCAGSGGILSNFDELLAYTSQLHLREASELCKNALRRINPNNNKERKQARISSVSEGKEGVTRI